MKEHAPKPAPEDGGRRKFLTGLGAGVLTGLTTGLTTGLGINKYIKHEVDMTALTERYKGQEANFSLAIEAVGELQNRMEEQKIEKVRISGISQSDEVSILRDYLQAHLNAKGVGYKYGDVQKEILDAGYFTLNNLDKMKRQAEKAREI